MTPEEFLFSQGFIYKDLDRSALIAAFHREMEAGLKGEASSLKMIPSYLSPYGEVAHGVSVAVLDAGGTNFRSATVTLPADGADPLIEHREQCQMPGVTQVVDTEAFYKTFSDEVRRVMPFAKVPRVGFCFSYACEASSAGDAKLLLWSKQILAPTIVGQWVGAGLKAHMGEGAPQFVVLNDTVATLLAGKALEKDNRYSAYIGFILGTGTNIAYVEKNSNIPKVAGLPPEGAMAVNAESGAFARIERSAFDEALDARTTDPGTYRFEKMISGAYLGRVAFEILRAAAKAKMFENEAAFGTLCSLKTLLSPDVDDFCANVATPENPLVRLFPQESDRALARRLVRPVFERAAILTAIHLAAFIAKTGGGVNPLSPVCVNVDGSTYWKTRTIDFPKIVTRELDALLGKRNIYYSLTHVEDAPMIGAAVAALLHK